MFTPPELRGGAWARSAVAASSWRCGRRRVARSVLFTGEDNLAAQRAYLALGYEIVGDFGLILLD